MHLSASGHVRRRVRAAATTVTVLAATALSTTSAHAATEYWFGDIEVKSYDLQEWQTSVLAEVTHPTKTHPLPLQSYAVATLYDCTGAKVRTQYGFTSNEKRNGGKWRTTVSVDLGVDPAAGPYKEWVVAVHSKGRAPVSETVRSSDAFTFGCAPGEFVVHEKLAAPISPTRKPINADFSTSAEKLIAQHMKFGKVVGGTKNKVRVGAKVGIKGTGRVVKGKVRSNTCSTAIEGTHPTRKGWIAGIGGQCDSRFVIAPKMRFWTNSGNVRTVSAVGKKIHLSSSVDVRGHNYTRIHDLGKVKKKR